MLLLLSTAVVLGDLNHEGLASLSKSVAMPTRDELFTAATSRDRAVRFFLRILPTVDRCVASATARVPGQGSSQQQQQHGKHHHHRYRLGHTAPGTPVQLETEQNKIK